jgi:Rac GTPase-activating protein 1
VYKCRDCDLVVHPECKEHVERPCYLPIVYPAHGTISDYVANEAPYVPLFLQNIITEIEIRGIGKEVGLYRVNGYVGMK